MRIFRIFLLGLWITGVSEAGVLSDDLAYRLDGMDNDRWIRIIVMHDNQYPAAEIAPELTRSGISLAERHRHIVSQLISAAETRSGDTMDYLDSLEEAGTAGDIRRFWIANMIALRIKAGEIEPLASVNGVSRIYPDYEISLISPVESYGSAPLDRNVETGIERINARALWNLGVYGSGTIVMNIDTGVDGNHPALSDRWHGNFVPADQSWLDPTNPSSDFPTDNYWVTDGHGTHTMGTMCGMDGTDTIGVAPLAHWIAAGEFFDTSGPAFISSIISAFQWGADPDGNPATFNDVPDVISNSWGLNNSTNPSQPPCDDTFWSFIDNAEAAGAVVVFAAGNEGSYGSETIRRPADRITTDVNAFSVGAVNGNTESLPIAYFSSRGPSGCDHQTIKPEIVAPGVSVRSSIPGGSYGIMSGTSMACPHVAGAVALLRELSPTATPEAIKTALYMTALDLGPTGEDNTYGNGMIDVYEAALLLGGGFAQVEGVVLDSSSGHRLADVRVRLNGSQYELSTNDSGQFALTVTAGDYEIQAQRFDYFPFTDSVFLAADTTTLLDIRLPPKPWGTVMGVVKDAASGQGIVASLNVELDGEIVLSATTLQGTGFYNLNLPRDTYVLYLRPPFPYPDVVIDTLEVQEDITQIRDFSLSTADILLWNPSNQELAIKNVRESLVRNNKTTRSVRILPGTINDLINFDAVFAFLGIYPNNYTLQGESHEVELLTQYLDMGGNVYMEGGNAWYNDLQTELHEYFGINGLSQGFGDLSMVSGNGFADSIDLQYALWADNESIDQLQPVGNASVIHTNTSPVYNCGIAYDAGSYRTIGTSFLLGALEPGTHELDELVSRYLEFYGIYSLCVKGDMNEDSEVNVMDVVRAVNIILGYVETPSTGELCALDYNDDGDGNIVDVVGIIQHVLNNN